jgi:aminoglycoside phosphotransferase (APT) family kinase protein
MKINSSDQYLKLIIRSLETIVIPDLKSKSATGIAEIICAVLLELRKREGPAPASLMACIKEGELLESLLNENLGEEGKVPAVDQPASIAEPGDELRSFSAMIERHALLTERLTSLSDRVAMRRRINDIPDAEIDFGGKWLRRVAEWEMGFYERQALLAVGPSSPALAERREPLSREFLQRFLNEQRHEGSPYITVSSFEPLLGGYGKQTYLCRTIDQTGSEAEFVVRKTDPLDHMKFGFSAIEQEFHLLRSLSKTDFPSPRPEYLGSHLSGVDGSFFTMPRIAGQVAGTFLGGVSEGHSQQMYLQLAELMATLHRMPIETFADYINAHGDPAVLSANVGDCYRLNLEAWRRYVDENEFLPSPYLSWLFDWLDHHVPRDSRKPVLVHGDFNVHNILASHGAVTGVLDWECAGFGAPEQDLAYVRPHIAKHIDWDTFVARYHACGGPQLNQDAMQFCLVYSAIRVNLGGNRLTYNLQRGTNWDIRYAMVDLGFSQAFMQMGLSA